MKKEKRMLVQDQRWSWLDYLFFITVVGSCMLTAWTIANVLHTIWGLLRG